MNVNAQMIQMLLINMIAFIFAGSIHEFSHASSAYLFGDDTAKNMGRMTINPLVHIDPFGLIFPFILSLMGLPAIGWMKPVPVAHSKLNDPSRDSALVSFAGPYSNILQGFIGFLIAKILLLSNVSFDNIIFQFFFYYTIINFILMFFNLLPIPPLDGGWILRYFLPDKGKNFFDRYFRFGSLILLILVFSGGIGKIIRPIFALIFDVFIFFVYSNEIFLIIIVNLALWLITFLFIRKPLMRLNVFTKNKLNETFTQSTNDININEKILTDKVLDNNKIERIIDKLKQGIQPNNDDLIVIEKAIEKISVKGEICSIEEFDLDDTHCRYCDYYLECLKRYIETTSK